LPSEAEWEYAARAGSETLYYMGDEHSELCAHANAANKRALEHYPGFAVNDCDEGYVRTSPVASFAASPWGLYDIYGNVWSGSKTAGVRLMPEQPLTAAMYSRPTVPAAGSGVAVTAIFRTSPAQRRAIAAMQRIARTISAFGWWFPDRRPNTPLISRSDGYRLLRNISSSGCGLR